MCIRMTSDLDQLMYLVQIAPNKEEHFKRFINYLKAADMPEIAREIQRMSRGMYQNLPPYIAGDFCPDCSKDTLVLIPGDGVYDTDYLECPYCNATYNIKD